jgi:hypothetical protein
LLSDRAPPELHGAENRARDFLLPSGKQLSEAEQLLAEYGEELTPELKAYVAASMAQAHAQQKRRQRFLVGALVLFAFLAVGATAAAFFGFWQKIETEKQKQVAVAAKVEAQAKEKDAVTAKGNLEVKNRELETLLQEAARSDLLVAQERLQRGEDGEALAHLARAGRYVPKSSLPAEIALPAVLSPPIAHSQANFQGHTGVVYSAVFSPDGRRVLTASWDKTARLWEAFGNPAEVTGCLPAEKFPTSDRQGRLRESSSASVVVRAGCA